MQPTRYDCDCDTVIDMEQMGIGVEEMLQYARAILARDELLALSRGIQDILDRAVAAEVPEPTASVS